MKKILCLLMVAVMGLMVTGCEKGGEATVVGAWRLKKVGPSMDQLVDVSSIGAVMTIKFNADGTWTGTGMTPMAAPMQLPILKSGSPDGVDAQSGGTWSYSEESKVLHMTENSVPYDVDVTKLTASEMVWYWELTSSYLVFRK